MTKDRLPDVWDEKQRIECEQQKVVDDAVQAADQAICDLADGRESTLLVYRLQMGQRFAEEVQAYVGYLVSGPRTIPSQPAEKAFLVSRAALAGFAARDPELFLHLMTRVAQRFAELANSMTYHSLARKELLAETKARS
jgi:hypothetical protein